MLTQEEIKGNWKQLKGKVKERWGQLTDDDLSNFNGNVDQLVGTIQRRTGKARNDIENELEDIWASSGSMLERVTSTAKDVGHAIGEKASAAYETVSDSVREGYQATERVIQEHPGKSMAVAFGVGLISGIVVGMVVGSR
jgi:uncharacterized protein YjbJ (UPF0337 family)